MNSTTAEYLIKTNIENYNLLVKIKSVETLVSCKNRIEKNSESFRRFHINLARKYVKDLTP